MFFAEMTERIFDMMNTGSIGPQKSNWQAPNPRQISEEMKTLASTKTEKSTDDKDSANPVEEEYDQYIKSNGQPERAPGIYRLEKDENGNPKIAFERPDGENGNNTPDISALGNGNKKPEPEDDPKKVEVGKSVGDDSQWKAEIDKIKQEKSQLSREISSAGDDEDKRKELEAQLAKVEAELAAKDTEAYRKQRTVVRYLGSQMMDAEDAAKLA